jgi:germination protein M
VRRFALPLTAVLLLAGCGGGQTGAPATSAVTETAPPETATATGTETAPQDVTTFGVFFVRDGKVAPAYRAVPQTEAVGTAALEALLAGPTADERELGLSSTIPSGTRVMGLDVKDGIATLDLSPEFEPLRPSEQLAENLAQIVFTLTQFSTIRGVWVASEGEPIASQSKPLGRDQFPALTPTILVEHPAAGQTVTSPIPVSGTASVFEATLRVRLEGPSGEKLWEDTVTASEGAPGRGTFAVEIPFAATGPGKIVAFEPSAKDGSEQHTFEVRVVLAP